MSLCKVLQEYFYISEGTLRHHRTHSMFKRFTERFKEKAHWYEAWDFFFSLVPDGICSWQKFTLAWTKSHCSPLLLYGIPPAQIVIVPTSASAPASRTPTGTAHINPQCSNFSKWDFALWITELTLKCFSGHTFSHRKK